MTVVRLSDPPLWRIVVTNRVSRTLTFLDSRAKDRAFAFVHNGPSSHVGRVASDDPEVNIAHTDGDPFLHHNSRLVYALRREAGAIDTFGQPWAPRWSGILFDIEDAIDDNSDVPTSRYTAYDSWQLLYRRPAYNPDTLSLPGRNGLKYRDKKLSELIVELLVASVTVDGDCGIDMASITEVDSVEIDFDVARGESVGEVWDRAVATGTVEIKLPPVYDPVLRPGVINELVVRPCVGSRRDGAVFTWNVGGTNLTDLSRLVDGKTLANKVEMYAGAGGDPVTPQIDAASVAKYGVYWEQQFATGDYPAALVETLALATARIRRDGNRSITFSPAPEWSPLSLRDYGTGDFVPVWASRYLRDPIAPDLDNPPVTCDDPSSGYLRVYGIPITVDDEGVEHVQSVLTSDDITGAG